MVTKKDFDMKCLQKFLFSGCFLVFLAGCVSYPSENCISKVKSSQLKLAEQKVISYISKNESAQQSKVFEHTYILEKTEACRSTVFLYYKPDPNFRLKLRSGGIAVLTGSKVRYIIDFDKNTIIEDYLD